MRSLLLCAALLLSLSATAIADSGPTASIEPPGELTCRPRSECCKVCRKGKACGNSCINRRFNCTKPQGCACNASDICE